MEKRTAKAEAKRRWGPMGTVWRKRGADRCRVGVRLGQVLFVHGWGKTWEEAFTRADQRGDYEFFGVPETDPHLEEGCKMLTLPERLRALAANGNDFAWEYIQIVLRDASHVMDNLLSENRRLTNIAMAVGAMAQENGDSALANFVQVSLDSMRPWGGAVEAKP